jgi:hypothetical protein
MFAAADGVASGTTVTVGAAALLVFGAGLVLGVRLGVGAVAAVW